MLALLGSSLAFVTECTSKHFVDADLSERSDDGTMVPGTVSLDGVPKGFPSQGNLASCDQIAAIGPNGPNDVRGVSDLIEQGFSLGWLGTTGEEIEFRYWSEADQKEYYVHEKYVMGTISDNTLAHMATPMNLALSLAPYQAPCGCAVGCSHVKMTFSGYSWMNVNQGECEAIEGTCQTKEKVGETTRTCHTSADSASANCFTPCA
mmetsp:Transcript_7713/g.18112  ORF Transcript_7713/g.18112 Transcript_7713/m.18112 type:complete len:206 (-) Transcript_7713:240-857(-)